MQESWEGMGRRGKLFKVNNGGERVQEEQPGRVTTLGRRGAFYRGPRKLAVGTYSTRSLRWIDAGVSGPTGYSGVYTPESPAWTMQSRESGQYPAGLRFGVLGVVTLDSYDPKSPDRSLRCFHTGVSGAHTPEYPPERCRSLRTPEPGQKTAQTKTAITRASELRIRWNQFCWKDNDM